MLGAKVKLVKHPYQPAGEIISVNHVTDMVTVLWDGNLIPKTEDYPTHLFIDGTFVFLDGLSYTKVKSKCECGAKFDKDFPAIHSFWCPARTDK